MTINGRVAAHVVSIGVQSGAVSEIRPPRRRPAGRSREIP
jgi:hypothetical protein